MLPWAGVTSVDDLISFAHDIKGARFSKSCKKLSEVISFLEGHDKVRFSLAEHHLKKGGDGTWVVSPKVPIKFCIMSPEAGTKEKLSDQNFGSLFKVSEWAANERLHYVLRWRYMSKKNEMMPGRPAVFLKDALRVKKGQFIPLN